MTPIDVGVSFATSSAADSGHLALGDVNVYGGGAKPWYVWATYAAMGAGVLLLGYVFLRK